ncbi:hypothetical protein GJ688_12790 [Heliobacillus mobilis]|uniref:Uncharacterized protein n=2 Tax=Heliobacterium TaxID=2697 RepID=A0A6I3SLT3_HELMO|nr:MULTISPECIES: hypothetical protein [Heliobacterium]MBC9785865.1 hypothetical protein [Heliobacterium chlorum]MTV49849.1 hypothetical protein [Heliobacterium mobile]
MAKYRINTPNAIYNGVTEGVLFQNGEAIIEDERLKNLLAKDYGYTVEEIKEETVEDKKPKTPIK